MIVRDEGSIWLVTPVTEAEETWINDHVGLEDSGYQPMYPTLVVEARYVDGLLTGILDAGFELTKAGAR